MRFRFRLQKMLDFEETKEAIKKAEVAHALDEVQRLERQKLETESSLRKVLESTPTRLAEGAAWVPYQVSKVGWDLADSRRLGREIQTGKERLETLQFELSRISMKKKALEKLRDSKEQLFKQTESRREQKKADELYQLSKRRER